MKLMQIYESINSKKFGKMLMAFLNSSDVIKILDDDQHAHYTTFMSGSCYLLAAALLQIIPSSKLYGVFRNGGIGIVDDEDDSIRKADHFIVGIDGFYIDGNGVQTEKEVLNYFETVENIKNPTLEPATIRNVHSETPSNEYTINRIKDIIEAEIANNEKFGKIYYRFMTE